MIWICVSTDPTNYPLFEFKYCLKSHLCHIFQIVNWSQNAGPWADKLVVSQTTRSWQMYNVIDCLNVLMKKNRIMKKEKRKEKEEKDRVWTDYFEYRRSLRKVSVNLVEACLRNGKVIEQNGALHYVLNNLHVVVDIHDEVLITTYLDRVY